MIDMKKFTIVRQLTSETREKFIEHIENYLVEGWEIVNCVSESLNNGPSITIAYLRR